MIDSKKLFNFCEEHGYSYKLYGKKSSLAIIGEIHSEKFRPGQEEIIKLVSPEYLLYECLQIKTYDPFTKKAGRLENEDLYDDSIPAYLADWAHEYAVKLAGIDISLHELGMVAKDILSRFPDYERNHEFNGQTPKEVYYREIRMGTRIKQFFAKTDKNLVAIVGAHHIRPSSEIHDSLKEAKISYICINQTVKKSDCMAKHT